MSRWTLFMGHLDLYVEHIPEDMKLKVAVSFLGGHAFDWFKVISQVESIETWSQLKKKLVERFQPVNKVKMARDKLAIWKQTKSVGVYNESFMKIVIDIPRISQDEVIDRYMRGLKSHISKELCTKEYTSLTTLMSDALSVEASRNSFLRTIEPSRINNNPAPMDISNTSLRFRGQKQKDYENGSCFICHKKNCRVAICPERKDREFDQTQGKDPSQ